MEATANFAVGAGASAIPTDNDIRLDLLGGAKGAE